SADADDARYMHQFQFTSVGEIRKATESAARLEGLFATHSFGVHSEKPISPANLLAQVEAFDKRYREELVITGGNTPDAIRFRDDLLRTGDAGLLEKEKNALADIEQSIQNVKTDLAVSGDGEQEQTRWSHARQLRRSLAALYDVNVGYARLAYEHVVTRTHRARNWLLAIGGLGAGLTLFLGLFVHRAITPRIRRLVTKVNRFREF